MPRGFSRNLIFAIIARMLCGNLLNKILFTAKNSLTIIEQREYFAVNKISLTPKNSLTIILQREYFAVKTDSAQSQSNKCKNQLLKIYSQHSNFWNTFYNNSLQFISLSDPAIKFNSQAFSRNLMSNIVRMLKAWVSVFLTEVKRPF